MSISAFRDLLRELPPIQLDALAAHYELLCRWNKTLNLTRIDKVEEVVIRHYRESLFLGSQLTAGRVVDIGSGAGFPGLVVAVARPDCYLTLVESHQRKAVFLREASRGFPNVRVLARRAEDVAETFDWMISRAVSYEDLGKAAIRLAPRLALLTGTEPPPESWRRRWEVLPLPSGKQYFLRVSRETDELSCFT